MCLRGVERRHEVEKNGVAMMINEIGINFRIGKMWGGVNKKGRSVAKLDPLSKRGALKKHCHRQFGIADDNAFILEFYLEHYTVNIIL